MIKIVAFDLMGVIFDESHIISNLLFPMLPEPKDYNFVKEKYNLYTEGKISNEEFWTNILKNDYKKFEKYYLDSLKLDVNYDKIISYLKRKYKLGIISDLPKEWGDYLIKKFELDKIFDPITISGKVKVAKPNLKIYKIFQKEAGVSFNETIFVDDRKSCLKSAKLLGMKTVWLNREEDKLDFTPDYTIKSLLELKGIL